MAAPMPRLRFHDRNRPGEFGFGVQVLKNGTSSVVDIGSAVSQMDLYYGLNSMAMGQTLQIADAAGALAKYHFQPGDQIRTVITGFQSNNDIIATLTIIRIGAVDESESRKFRTYSIEALDKSAMLNKRSTVTKAYNLTASAIVTDACKQIGVDEVDSEPTLGTLNYIAPMCSVYDCIKSIYSMSVSQQYGPGNQFYFYQDPDGFHYKSLAWLVHDGIQNHTWNYYLKPGDNLAINVNRKIMGVTHEHLVGNAFIYQGALENELVRFNHLYRTIKSYKSNYQDDFLNSQLMGKNPMVDLADNYTDWVTPATDNRIGVRSMVAYGGDPTVYNLIDTQEQNFGKSVAQNRLFSQIMYHLALRPNALLRPGHIIHIKANQVSGSTTPQADAIVTGNYLVVNVRSSISVGEQYITFADVVSDSQQTNLFTNSNG